MAFEITESGADYHLTLLLSPFGFTTYMKNSTDSDYNTTTDSSLKDSPLNETSNITKHIDAVIISQNLPFPSFKQRGYYLRGFSTI